MCSSFGNGRSSISFIAKLVISACLKARVTEGALLIGWYLVGMEMFLKKKTAEATQELCKKKFTPLPVIQSAVLCLVTCYNGNKFTHDNSPCSIICAKCIESFTIVFFSANSRFRYYLQPDRSRPLIHLVNWIILPIYSSISED